MHLLLSLVLLAGCEGLYNPDDCRQNDEDCAVYRPEGLLCGLVADPDLYDKQGSLCDGHDPSLESLTADACPPGDTGGAAPWEPALFSEHEGDMDWQFCHGHDNAAESSGDLAEVPAGVACGLNTTHRTDSHNLCHGVDPLAEGRCPEGFTLRYALDVYHDCPESQPPVPDPPQCERPDELFVGWDPEGCDGDGVPTLGHLVVWCERDAVDDQAATYPDDTVCGLHGNRKSDPLLPDFWHRLRWEELTTEICATMTREWEQQRAEASQCRGVDVQTGGCPEGMSRACLHDAHGSSLTAEHDFEALCWCTTGEILPPPE